MSFTMMSTTNGDKAGENVQTLVVSSPVGCFLGQLDLSDAKKKKKVISIEAPW
jgi:hypothetical protein